MARLFVASLLAIVFNQGCYITGVGLTSPADASIITTSMPLWAMMLAAVFLKEPITGKKVLGIASGAGGALLLILGSSQTGGAAEARSSSVAGDLLVVTAQLSYALYFVLFKDFVARYSLVTIMKWMFTYSFICLLPFSAGDLLQTQWAALSLGEVASLAFIVVCATYLCYSLIVVGQKALRPTVAGMLQLRAARGGLPGGSGLGHGQLQPSQAGSRGTHLRHAALDCASRSRADMEQAGQQRA